MSYNNNGSGGGGYRGSNNDRRDGGGYGGDRRSNYGGDDRRSDYRGGGGDRKHDSRDYGNENRDRDDRRSGYNDDRRGGGGDRNGGYDQHRGSYDRGSGSYDRDRGGGYDRDRGGYDRGRGGGGGGGGGFDRSGSRPYDNNRGGGGGFRGRGGGGRGGGGRDFTEVDVRDVQEIAVIQPETLPAEIPSSKETKVQMNAFALDLSKARPVYVYDFTITGVRKPRTTKPGDPPPPPPKRIELTQHSSNDATRNIKFDCLEEIFQNLINLNAAFFQRDKPDILYVYDRSKIFYCSENLLVDNEYRRFEYEVKDLNLTDSGYIRKFGQIVIDMQRTGYIDPQTLVSETNKDVRTKIQQYIDLLTSQQPMRTHEFFTFGPKMFKKDSIIPLRNENRFVLKDGIQKNTRVVENDKGTGFDLLVQIDHKRSAFRANIPVLDYLAPDFRENDLRNPNNKKAIANKLRTICVETTHLQYTKKFIVSGVTALPADRIFFYDNDKKKEVSVPEYYSDKYHFTLRHPEYPCLMETTNKRGAAFPMEVLKISDGQRVPLGEIQKVRNLNENIIRACQQKPLELSEAIKEQARALEFNNSNDVLKCAGVRFKRSGHFVEATAKELVKPSIVYADKQLNLTGPSWKNDENRFLDPARIESLAVIGYPSRDAENFGSTIVTAARRFGMNIIKNEFIPLRNDRYEDIQRLCNELKRDGFTFLFFISESKNVHNAIKYVELNLKLPTQQILPKSTKGGDTLKNILFKVNMKAAGRNHTIATNPSLAASMGGNGIDFVRSYLNTSLIIGIEMTMPTNSNRFDTDVKQLEPVCVGYASTVDGKANVMSGGYFFQTSRNTIVHGERLGERVIDSMKTFYLKSQSYPKQIILYRSGASEGQFLDIKEKECDIMKRTVHKYCNDGGIPPPNFAVIAVQKKTNHRLFQNTDDLSKHNERTPAFVQNIAPGTVIVGKGTNPAFKEFIMVAQKALLGTAKPIVGTIIYEYPYNSANIQHLTDLSHALCYMHEVSTGAISVPAPLRSAEQLAQRGKNNWVQWKTQYGDTTSTSSFGSQHLTDEQKDENLQRFNEHCDDLSQILKTTLDCKFWA